MKSMQSNRVRKRKKYTLLQRIKMEYKKLPEWQKKYIDIEQAAKVIANTIKLGYDTNPKTGKRTNIKNLLRNTATSRARLRGEGTLRDMYRRFRLEEPSIYAKYNSYMYRQHLSASQYFYENAVRKTDGSITTLYIELPKGKKIGYEMLEVVYDYSNEEFNAYIY